MPGQLEHEVRFRIDNSEEVIAKLLNRGVCFVDEYMQIRAVFDVGANKGTWLRLRKGKKTTLAIKQVTEQGTEESEVEVSSYEDMLQILANLGFTPKAEHQNYRREYVFNHSSLADPVNITVDTWPEIGHVLEVEGADSEQVVLAISLLGLGSLQPASAIWDIYEEDGRPSILDRDLSFSDDEVEDWRYS